MMSRCLDEGKKPNQKHENERGESGCDHHGEYNASDSDVFLCGRRHFTDQIQVLNFLSSGIQSQSAVCRKACRNR